MRRREPVTSLMNTGRSGNLTKTSETNLILIGKTGNGKSATGNTILGISGQRGAFKDSGDSSSVTQMVSKKQGEVDGRTVNVVDTPGLFDTDKPRGQWEQEAAEHLAMAIKKCHGGVNALVLVFKYGSRFTDEEEKVVDIFKKYLGENFFRDHCVVIFTHGEELAWQMKRKKSSLTFEKWLFQERGGLARLIGECQHRVVLFSNMTPGNEEPLKKFLKMVDEIRIPYTFSMYQEMRKERNRLLVRESILQQKDGLERKGHFLMGKFNTIRQMDIEEEGEEILSQLDALERDTLKLKEEIDEADRGTGELLILSQLNKSLLEGITHHRTGVNELMQATINPLDHLNSHFGLVQALLAQRDIERNLQRNIRREVVVVSCSIQ